MVEESSRPYKQLGELIDDGNDLPLQQARFFASLLGKDQLTEAAYEMIGEKNGFYDRAIAVFIEYGADADKILDKTKELFPETLMENFFQLDSDRVGKIEGIIESAKHKKTPAFLDPQIEEDEFLKIIDGVSAKDLDKKINGETLLTFAARRGFLDAVNSLLDKGANPKTYDIRGENALEYLMRDTKVDPELKLFQKFENPYFADSKKDNQLASMALIIEKKDIKRVKDFKDNIKSLNSNQKTELAKYFVQSEFQNMDVLRIILDSDSAIRKDVQKLVNEKFPQGYIYNSEDRNNYDALFKELAQTHVPLEKKGFNFRNDRELLDYIKTVPTDNLDDMYDGKTLLTYAAEMGYFDSVKKLINRGCDPNCSYQDKTAYDYLIEHEDNELGTNQSRLGLVSSDAAQKTLDLLREKGGKSASALKTPTEVQKVSSKAVVSLTNSAQQSVKAKEKEVDELNPTPQTSTNTKAVEPVLNQPTTEKTTPETSTNTIDNQVLNQPTTEVADNLTKDPSFVELKKIIDPDKVRHVLPDDTDEKTLVTETGNENKGYKFEPDLKLIEKGQELLIEVPCLDKNGKMLETKEKLVFDPHTKEIKSYELPEGYKSRLDQEWFKSLKQLKKSQAMVKAVKREEGRSRNNSFDLGNLPGINLLNQRNDEEITSPLVPNNRKDNKNPGIGVP